MEEIERLKSKIKAVENERDEYVEMIGKISIVQKLNIQVFCYIFILLFTYTDLYVFCGFCCRLIRKNIRVIGRKDERATFIE